jgi:hypothetical protein
MELLLSTPELRGGAKAVRTNGTLTLQHVRAIYSRSSVFFWFEVGEKPVN